ncbi:SRPBCC family protein [Niabella drilacis]|uniref:Activator of Hsp90 ATPase homolog 1-like protein n=1 Tax=Niabella drilacis (strain DSM 25811 / CCM 8410 / CCUG 62505 / LMG 26954 / E90) TaxID=1285928 RepID=A0A1G6M2Z2_NIADE|nr:SRPBCC domain-containing protein [Niabella drilacis]SDC49840.1 Activator of Hsp90 ATPase homolog 1-like protein [Niabella drilacis]
MQHNDFTTTIQVTETPGQVFNAVNNVRGWWSEEVRGSTAQLNDEFLYHYKDVHICKLKLTEVIPGKKVVWLVLDNSFNFIQNPEEWKNTRIIFEIAAKDGGTELRFTHQGLVPQDECYNICRDAWTNYIRSSLYQLITTGKGQPNPKEGGFNSELLKKWNIQES